MHGELHKSAPYLFFRLELTQACICSFVPFFHPLGCVMCVRKEMCNVPSRRRETTGRSDLMAISGIRKLRFRVSAYQGELSHYNLN